MKHLIPLWLLLASSAFGQVVPGVPGGTVQGTPVGSTAPVPLSAAPTGFTMDLSALTQSSPSDTIPFGLIAPTAVSYPGGSITVSSANCGQIITENNSSASTVTFPAVTTPINPGCWVIVKNLGAGLVTNAVSASTTFNGASTSIYLSQYMAALFTADSTASPGNWDVSIGGGYLPSAVGVPIWATAQQANGFIPISTSCGSGGARVAEFSSAGLTFCTSGSASWTIDNSGNMNGVGMGYLNIPNNTGTIVHPPNGGLTSNGTGGNLEIDTNGVAAIKIDSSQNVYLLNQTPYTLLANSSAGTVAGIAYGALNTTLRGQGTTSPPAFSSTTTPNTSATGDLWYGSATNVVSALAIGTAAQNLTISSGIPAWSSNVAVGATIALSASQPTLAISGTNCTSIGTVHGGYAAGSAVVTTSGSCTAVITLSALPTTINGVSVFGWKCVGSDETHTAGLVQSSSTSSTAVLNGTVSTTADKVSWACTAYQS